MLNAKACNCRDLRKSIIEMFWILADNSQWIKTMTHIITSAGQDKIFDTEDDVKSDVISRQKRESKKSS